MLAILGSARWKRETAREVGRLAVRQPAIGTNGARYERSSIATLPAPVRRYFEFALTPGQPMVEGARVEWSGEFSMRPRRWSSFSATQYYRTRPPGFVWDAKIRMTPMLPVLVRDAYVDREGSLLAAIGGVMKVANQHGTPELAAGELLRYLGEAVWFPTALLPAAGVTWTALDHQSATATLSDGATTVSMDAHFAASGAITSLTAMRERSVNGHSVRTPWTAHLADYAEHDGMKVPTSGDVEWELPAGPLPYWRGRLVSVQYDFARS